MRGNTGVVLQVGKPETARVRPGGGEPILAETRTERRGTGIARVPAKRPVAAALPRGESRRGRDRKGDFRREEGDDPRCEEGDDPSREEGDDPRREEGDDPRREEGGDAHAREEGARVRSGGDDARAREALVPQNVGGRDGDGKDDARLRRRREKRRRRLGVRPARRPRLRARRRDRLRALRRRRRRRRRRRCGVGGDDEGAVSRRGVSSAARDARFSSRVFANGALDGALRRRPPPERDSVKTLDQLRRKMEMKLDHELEDGWRVEWEPGANGREEKVYYDPAAPGKKLLGDAMALTHVKMRLAALAVQQRAAAEAAAKMAADAKGEERAAAEAYAAVAAKIAVSSGPGDDGPTRRGDGRRARRAQAKIRVGRLRRGTGGVGGAKLPPAERAKLGSGSESVPALPAPEAATTPGTATKSTPGTATKTPVGATKEERARMELVERVYGETGVRLGPDWRVTYRPKSDGSFHRFIFSPGGEEISERDGAGEPCQGFQGARDGGGGRGGQIPRADGARTHRGRGVFQGGGDGARELLKQVFDEAGVMLGANWRRLHGTLVVRRQAKDGGSHALLRPRAGEQEVLIKGGRRRFRRKTGETRET